MGNHTFVKPINDACRGIGEPYAMDRSEVSKVEAHYHKSH